MKIYFTASTADNTNLNEDYKQIIEQIKKNHSMLISGEQIVNKELLESDKKLTSTEIFQREKSLIMEADLVIAEVTKPSLGVGGEIVYALVNNKPVLALVKSGFEDQISPMISGNPSENLFVEYYTEDNIHLKITDFITHVKNTRSRIGKLIVIDGGDGSGKTTQTELLISYLKGKKIPTHMVDFPQYYNSFQGRLVARFLRGEFGNLDEVSPYLASLAYALDRVSVKREMDEFLQKGGMIVANRYVTSSLAHQGAKFSNPKEKEAFLKWLYELEYKVHKMPKEDLVIYLYVPWQIGIKLTEKKGNRQYLNGKESDIAEKDLHHRLESEKMYLAFAQKYKHWIKIDCVDQNGNVLPKEEINRQIIKIIEDKRLIDKN